MQVERAVAVVVMGRPLPQAALAHRVAPMLARAAAAVLGMTSVRRELALAPAQMAITAAAQQEARAMRQAAQYACLPVD